MLMVGLMSGTSADGVDAALVDIVGEGRSTSVRLLAFVCLPHAPAMREAILALCDPARGTVPDLCAMDAALGDRFALAARDVADAAGVDLADVAAIASHGQTVWHQPEPRAVSGTAATGTLQIGSPAVIAARTGRPVISDFRAADMAAGGQGAPLVPYADWALLARDDESRAVQNIGGIANVTHLPRGASLDDVLAFDTGPGNVIIDALVCQFTSGERTYDEAGGWAAQGEPARALADWVLAQPFFSAPPPKSTGRELFSEAFVGGFLRRAHQILTAGAGSFEADVLATATYVTAASISGAYHRWLEPRGVVQTVIVGGGGSHNGTLMRMLRELLAPARVTTHEEMGIPDDAKEAIAFALLGYETLHGRPSSVPAATGAAYPAVLGSITPAPRAE